MKKKIAIIGAGISGLSLAWYLEKYAGNKVEVSIYEASNRVGGFVHTISENGFLFEQGPHSWRCENFSSPLDELIEDVSLSQDIVEASLDSKIRYIYYNKKLQKLPSSIFSLWKSPFKGMMFKAICKDLFTRKGRLEDESIYNFISRRLGVDIAETFFRSFSFWNICRGYFKAFNAFNFSNIESA